MGAQALRRAPILVLPTSRPSPSKSAVEPLEPANLLDYVADHHVFAVDAPIGDSAS